MYIAMKTFITGVLTILTSSLFATIPPISSPDIIKRGELVYKSNCVACHGSRGSGDGPLGKVLTPSPRDLVKDVFKQGTKPLEMFRTITRGIPGSGMAGYSHLSEKDRWSLVYFILSIRKDSELQN